jgi:hypothetical protein
MSVVDRDRVVVSGWVMDSGRVVPGAWVVPGPAVCLSVAGCSTNNPTSNSTNNRALRPGEV